MIGPKAPDVMNPTFSSVDHNDLSAKTILVGGVDFQIDQCGWLALLLTREDGRAADEILLARERHAQRDDRNAGTAISYDLSHPNIVLDRSASVQA